MHKTLAYKRTPIMNFFELTDAQKDDAFITMGEEAQANTYVADPRDDNNVLPLGWFHKYNAGLWDGVLGLSYFDAYYVRINSLCDEAIVAYRYW